MRTVRITCLPINASSERPIFIDAVLNESDEICGGQALFGTWGKFTVDEEFYPFVLRGDGIIDYGAALDSAADRFFDFDIRNGKITINRILSYKSKDRSIVVSYLIDEISDLTTSNNRAADS